jgi:hypothetical protein
VITATDDERLWLERIARQLEEPSPVDAWAILQTVATLLLAVFAAYVSWRAHSLSRATAKAEAVRLETAERDATSRLATVERDAFRMAFYTHVAGLPIGWGGSKPGDDNWSNTQSYISLSLHAVMLDGGNTTTGASRLVAHLEAFEVAADTWSREERDSLRRFGAATRELIKACTLWAKDGNDHPVPPFEPVSL